MPPSPRTPSMKGQFYTCLLLVAVAIAITLMLHPGPAFAEWRAGRPVEVQWAVAAAFAALCAVGGFMALSVGPVRRRIQAPAALRNIDLSGARPWLVGLFAGVGEELLFRAALQPLVGLWVGAVIFAAAHLRTASLGAASRIKQLAYLLNVALAGVALGLVFQHLGLVAAILMHATIDVAGLLVLRSLAMRSTPAGEGQSVCNAPKEIP